MNSSDSPVSVSHDRGKPTAAAEAAAEVSTASEQTPDAGKPSAGSPSLGGPGAGSPSLGGPGAGGPSARDSGTSDAPAPSYYDAVRTLSPREVTTLHKKPCTRESLLTGIGTGFGVGGLRLVLAAGPWGGRQYRAMSWAVGTFVLVSGGAYAFCQRRRALEKAAMLRATAIVEEKKKAKRAELERLREIRRAEIEREEAEGGLWKWVGWR